MTNIARWLDSLGLVEYGPRFAEEAIDIANLRDLTEHDLAELGVKIGHRARIMRARPVHRRARRAAVPY